MAKTPPKKHSNSQRSSRTGKFVKKKTSSTNKPKPKKKDDDCFITTACIKAKGLPDDCYELVSLRKFRDDFVLIQPNGKKLVRAYYKIAPRIIKKINADNNSKVIYDLLFLQIRKACLLIDNNNKKKAFELYKDIVKKLIIKYE